jgi:hypothetical protein
LSGLVTVIDSVAAVKPLVLAGGFIPDERLVILDMYSTLTMPPAPVRAYMRSEAYQYKLQEMLSFLSKEERIKTLSLGFHVNNHQLVEANAPVVIRSIQASGNKVMVLTSSLSGTTDKYYRHEAGLYQKLQSLGIDLKQAFPIQELTLNNLPAYEGRYPTYYKGLLATNSHPDTNAKGIVLVTFLQKLDYKPRQVVMVDDQSIHLYTVKEALSKFDASIEFSGLLFEGAKKYSEESVQEVDFMAYWKEQVANMLRS